MTHNQPYLLPQPTLFNLNSLFDGIRAKPSDYYWLYLMMFSTLLPAACCLLPAAAH